MRERSLYSKESGLHTGQIRKDHSRATALKPGLVRLPLYSTGGRKAGWGMERGQKNTVTMERVCKE